MIYSSTGILFRTCVVFGEAALIGRYVSGGHYRPIKNLALPLVRCL